MEQFQRMMKSPHSVKEVEAEAATALRALLDEVEAVEVEAVDGEPPATDPGIDMVVRLTAWHGPHVLVCAIKTNGQPREVRLGLHRLSETAARFGNGATPVFIAPYLSPAARALCRNHGAGYLDLHGNARIVFGGVFIERHVPGKPPTERRALKSLFRPKSAQVLRMLLRDPGRSWRVAELAEAAQVSLGHVSNVRSALINRAWAEVADDGLRLSSPGALLDAWRDAYAPPVGQRAGFYTILHGSAFEDAARNALASASGKGRAVFASFSAAQWLAPYGRVGSQQFYADSEGLKVLKAGLRLAPASKGENVSVTLPKDEGPFLDAIEPAPGIVCTSAVQTYLDLSVSGERGREAADHLRRELLRWQT
ncbi:type IV toxin-antitoxin system AbiEi family antitoxin [Roseospira goensis]|uniref:Transcriptional regulator, AbiEi antitoxin, Type IV TA system n=1 Tax=Roseospira goensis TaxID=391922 RepID=A0A7W6RZH4_9PROT|nr:type IV toxin-antitoxin system AbiEi family antitoxin [Roseospira goensis]MBB4285417.1 hypothetical protein [Roseospira goensis]